MTPNDASTPSTQRPLSPHRSHSAAPNPDPAATDATRPDLETPCGCPERPIPPAHPGVGPVRDVPRRLTWLEHAELGHPTDTDPAAWAPTQPPIPYGPEEPPC